MNGETIVRSLSGDDLRAILRFQSENSSGSDEDVRERVRRKAKNMSWKFLLLGVPKESLQKLCADNGLKSDLPKDELIDQIVGSFSKPPKPGLLRDLFGPWQRWAGPGTRRR